MCKKGLTLLEILVSTLILALVMTGLANLFVTGKRYILRSRSRMTGGELGKYFLDPLQMQVNQSEWDSNCLSNSSLCTPQTQSIDGIDYNATYSTSNVTGTTLRRATVNITWNEPSP